MIPISEILAGVGAIGACLITLLVYLVKISAMQGKMMSKLERLEIRFDDQERIFEKMQLDHAQRIAWLESKMNGKGDKR